MTLRLDQPRLRELQRLAREAGLRPGQLAQRWVEERLAGIGSGSRTDDGVPRAVDADGAALQMRSTEAMTADLTQLSGQLAMQAERIDRLAEQVAALSAASATPATAPERRPVGAKEGGRRARLHEEIVTVLRAHGSPMSAGEIAQAIRERGLYRAPRSDEQVNGAMVSGRVSNPHYRSLFTRQGRRIGLAEAVPES